MDTGPAAIGRYQVRARLGQGGMGVLYLALDPAIDRLIALKLLRVDDDALRERFLREARLAARLQHPNIVTIYDVGSHEGQPFIAMEYIAGETLAELIQRRAALTPLRKLELLLDACQGLAYAHKNGIVHRDIKPANLMVNRDNDVLKVLDFGIARGAHSNLTQIGMLIGTPNYMAPEQVEGKPVDHRADVFALGLVLYELLVYRQAFKADTPHAVLHQVMHMTPTPVHQLDPALDPALASIIDKAIAKDPAARYSDLERLRLDLLRITQRLKLVENDETVIVAEHDGETRLTPGASIATRAIEAERDAREIDAWMQKARALFEAGSLTQAGQAVMEALQIDRQHAGAQALRVEIDRVFEERERHRERLQAITRALTKADESVRAGTLETALRATGEALGYDPGNADALAKRSQVLALVDRQAAVAIAEAREHMAAGRRDQALHRLQGFSPWHEGVEAALVALRQELGLPAQGLSGANARSGVSRPAPPGTVAGWTPHPAGGTGAPGTGAYGTTGTGSIGALPGGTAAGPNTAAPGTLGGASVATAGARRKSVFAYIAVAALVLIAVGSVMLWLFMRQPGPGPQSQNAALERPANPGGSGNAGGASGNPASGGTNAAGTGAGDKPTSAAGDPPAGEKPPTGGGTGATGATPSAPATAGTGRTPAPLPPPPGPGAPPVPAPNPAPSAGGVVDPASQQSVNQAMNDLQRVLGRRDLAGLEAVQRALENVPMGANAPESMRTVLLTAEREADTSRNALVKAQPGIQATPEFRRAQGEYLSADRAKRNRRPIEAIRRYWIAQGQFEAMRYGGAVANTGTGTTAPSGTSPATSASGTPAANAGSGAAPPPPAPPAPEAARPDPPRPADPVATTTKPTPQQPPPTATDSRPTDVRPADPHPPAVDNRAAIQQTLDRFATAYSTLKADSVRAVWVTMTQEQVTSLNRSFGESEQYTVALSNCRINEAGNGTATAQCARGTDIRFKNGTRAPRSDRPTFTLEKRGADWVIVGVKAS